MPDPNSPLTDADVEKYVRDIAAQTYAEKNKSTDPAPTEPAPIVLNIAGKEMSFKDAAEASSVLTSVYQQNQAAPPMTQGRQVTSDADTSTSMTQEERARWVDVFVADPIKAQEMLDEKRFGVKNPTEFIKQQMQATAGMATQMTIDRFVAENKDYHVCPENAQVMQQMLAKYGGSVTPDTLEAAYAIADKRGLLKKAETQENTPSRYNPYLAAPPIATRGHSQVSPNFEADVEAMSTDQIESLLLRSHR